MNPRGSFIFCVLLVLFLMAFPVNGVAATPEADHSEGSEIALRARMGNISSSLHNAALGVRVQGSGNNPTSTRNFAAGNESNSVSEKGKPKPGKLKLGIVLISLLLFTFINILSLSNNARICNNCGYTGSMKAVLLSHTGSLNTILVFLVGLFPVLLFYYAEKGRFFCPKCSRTSANVTVKSKIRSMEL